MKESEKLPNKVKFSLKKGRIIDKEKFEDKNKLNSLINDSLNIENNIQNVKKIRKRNKEFVE